MADTEGRSERIQEGPKPTWAERAGIMRRYVIVAEVRRTAAGTKRVEERLRAGKCVTCRGTTEQANPADSSKQQCEKCRSFIRRMLDTLSSSKQKARAIKKLISDGFLLHPREKSRLSKQDDPIVKIFEEVAKS